MTDAKKDAHAPLPRTQAAQDESWAKYGKDHYMRMIAAYVFAGQLECECAELRAALASADPDPLALKSEAR